MEGEKVIVHWLVQRIFTMKSMKFMEAVQISFFLVYQAED